jgi:hypothetical protein
VRLLRLAAVGCALPLLALSACGQGDDREQVRSISERFNHALDGEDGAAACDELSTDTVKALQSQEKKPCPEAILGLGLKSSGTVRVQVFVTSAKVDLESGQTAFLDRDAEGWRLSAIGCAPKEGKPADRPYDCELEG